MAHLGLVRTGISSSGAFWVYVTGEFFLSFNVEKSVFDQFLTWSNLKKFHFFSCYFY